MLKLYSMLMLKGKTYMFGYSLALQQGVRLCECHFTVNQFRSESVNLHQADTWWPLNLEEVCVCEALLAILHCSLMQRCTCVLYWSHPPPLCARTQPSVKMYEQTQSHRYSPCNLSSRHASLTFSHCLKPRWIHTQRHARKQTHTYTVAQIIPPARTCISLS